MATENAKKCSDYARVGTFFISIKLKYLNSHGRIILDVILDVMLDISEVSLHDKIKINHAR